MKLKKYVEEIYKLKWELANKQDKKLYKIFKANYRQYDVLLEQQVNIPFANLKREMYNLI